MTLLLTVIHTIESVARQSIYLYYSQELVKTKKSSKKYWQIIPQAAGLSSSQSNVKLDVNGEIVKGSVDIANYFNDHFVSIGIKTANSVQPSGTDFRKFIRRNPH